MQAFVRFLGFAAAIVAGVLGTVWVLEAMPPGAQAIAQAEIECIRRAGAFARCEVPRGWDDALVVRGLVALAVGVGLALMAARLPGGDGGAAQAAAREAEALRVLIEDEKRRARLQGGAPLSHQEAEARALRRLRGEG